MSASANPRDFRGDPWQLANDPGAYDTRAVELDEARERRRKTQPEFVAEDPGDALSGAERSRLRQVRAWMDAGARPKWKARVHGLFIALPGAAETAIIQRPLTPGLRREVERFMEDQGVSQRP